MRLSTFLEIRYPNQEKYLRDFYFASINSIANVDVGTTGIFANLGMYCFILIQDFAHGQYALNLADTSLL